MSAEQKTHPFVRAFLATAIPLAELISQHRHLNDPLVAALENILGAIGNPAKRTEALQNSAQLDLTGADPNLSIILFFHWSRVALLAGREMEAIVLHRRARTYINKNSPPVIRALINIMEMDIRQHGGDSKTARRIIQDVFASVSKTESRYTMFVILLCDLFCTDGHGVEVDRELQWLKEHRRGGPYLGRTAYIHLVHYISTGNIDAAALWLKELEKDTALLKLDLEGYRYFQLMIGLYRDEWGHGPLRPPEPGETDAEISSFAWSTYALLRHEPNLALQWARQDVRSNLEAINGSSLESFILLRAELALRHTSAARHLLELRRKRGTTHYFDDFFIARVEWQSGKPELAARHFAWLLKSVEHYRAEGRLEFELKLACELSAADVLKLGRLAERAQTDDLPPPAVFAPRAVVAKKSSASAGLVGASKVLLALRESLQRFASLPVPVLITGETGTGKELVARGLHETSVRKKKPFIAVNCGAIAETLLESELFGHARGAFTGAEREHAGVFEEADDGTLFLDEIGEITPRLQAALLRVLESSEIRPVGSSKARKISCRVLFATNVNLEDAVSAGTFRKDLFYRLRRLEIHIPALRERREDILPLARHFLTPEGSAGVQLLDELSECLQQYPWPGNVRELRNEMERMRLFTSDKGLYGLNDLAEHIRPAIQRPADAPAIEQPALKPAEALSFEHKAQPDSLTEAEVAAYLQQGSATIRRLDRLRGYFSKFKKLTRVEAAHILRISPTTATQDLKALCNEGFILKMQPTRAPVTHYFVLADTGVPTPK